MREEWKKYRISDVATVIGGGTPSTKVDEYYGGHIPWLTPKDMSLHNSKYISSGARYLTEIGLKKSSAKLLPKGTVLFTSRAPIGYIAIASKEVSTNQGFKSLICDEKIVHNEYMFYLLKNKVKAIESIASGSTFKEVSGNVLKEFIIELPPLKNQKKIAHILSTLDDKIELNRQMNRTLEAMAQALFKSWFVDFDPVHAKMQAKTEADLDTAAQELGISRDTLDLFPDRLVESEMGMVPEGWEVKPLKSIGKVVTGKTPSTKIKDNYGDKYPFITIPDMHSNTFIVKSARMLSEIGHQTQPKKLIPEKSLLVSCIATVGLVSINSKPCHTNQQINSIISEEVYLYYLYCKLNTMSDDLKMLGSAGTATLNVNKSIFENIEILLPSEELLDKFFQIIKPLFENILKNSHQELTLQKTRDTLLPKLLSGELDVSELEIK